MRGICLSEYQPAGGGAFGDGIMGKGRVNVTVIMPGRNEEARIDSTMESLLQQSRLPDEIIVADGCSSDGTVERVRRYVGGNVNIKIVRNDTFFAGGGRNAATDAASNELIVNMDFGNLVEPDWLASMVRPFEQDPELDLLGGLFYPRMETSFQRVVAAISYTVDCMLPTMSREDIVALVPKNFVPGGMCIAYRRSIWRKAGGFCAWAVKGQDRLFGYRVRKIGGKVGYTTDARVLHHMPDSFSNLIKRQFYYDLWTARLSLPGHSLNRLATAYVGGIALLLASIWFPWMLLVVLVALAAFAYRRAWRKLRMVSANSDIRFRLRDYLLSVPVFLVFDASQVFGRLIGTFDRMIRPSWGRKLKQYLETGS